jgi:hypothetical protein
LRSLLFFLLLVAANAYGADFKIAGKNGEVLFEKKIQANLSWTLGRISVDVFTANNIPFEGGEGGVASLFQLGSAMEVISNTEMKAYGWCFSVNGLSPDMMGDEFFLTGQDDQIVWYYAYAHYKDGQWIGACVTDQSL